MVRSGLTTACRLAELPTIIGVKDCCTDPAQSLDLIRRRPCGFAVMTGEDAQFHVALAQGADGGILCSAHVETERFATVYAAHRDDGDIRGALKIWHDLADLTRLLFAEPSQIRPDIVLVARFCSQSHCHAFHR